jgi:hypothetical protein
MSQAQGANHDRVARKNGVEQLGAQAEMRVFQLKNERLGAIGGRSTGGRRTGERRFAGDDLVAAINMGGFWRGPRPRETAT